MHHIPMRDQLRNLRDEADELLVRDRCMGLVDQPSASVKRSHRLTSSWSNDVMPLLRLDGHIRFMDSTSGPPDTAAPFTFHWLLCCSLDATTGFGAPLSSRLGSALTPCCRPLIILLTRSAWAKLRPSDRLCLVTWDHTGVEGVNQLHAALFRACCQVFPARAVRPSEKPWQTFDVQVGVRELWAKWRAFKQVRKAVLRGWFLAWQAGKDYDRQHREHQRRCKQAEAQPGVSKVPGEPQLPG